MAPASAVREQTPAPREIPAPVSEERAAADVEEKQQGFIVIYEELRLKCDLPEAPTQAPQFDYDEAALRARGRGILDQLGRCMREGALKESSLTITGHADPRGPEQYNLGLGMRRAEAARDYLVSQGVPASRITVGSRGEQEATGTDKGSWQLDRRVEIRESSP